MRSLQRLYQKYTIQHVYIFTALLILICAQLLPHNLLIIGINLFFILFLPGWLIVRLWKENIPAYERFLYAITLSLCALFVVGLTLNTLMPLIGVPRPLDPSIVKPTIWATIAILSFYSFRRKKFYFKISSNAKNINILLAIGLLLPLIAVCGANRLNALPGDWLANVALILIILYALIATWLAYAQRSVKYMPMYIFIISLSLLWMFSLRSHYVFGFDVNQEFHYFIDTLQSGHWTSTHNPYQACLSITILPTIITNYTNIAPELIFKVVYPAIFSLVPVVVYAIGRRYFSVFTAFLGSLLYIFQIHFLFQATALARQEIATLFLSVALLALFNVNWSPKKRSFMFLICSLGMILSHYSTTYIAVASFLVSYFIIAAYTYIRSMPRPTYQIPGIILSIIIMSVIGWNLQMTQSSTNLFLTIKQSFTSMPHIFQMDSQRSVVAQSIIGSNKASDSEVTQKYLEQFSNAKHDNYTENVLNVPLSGPSGGPRLVALFFHLIVPYIIKLFVIASVPFLLFTRRKSIPIVYRLLAVATLIYGVVLVLVPNLSLDYNVERLYQQSLILLAVPVIYLMLRSVKHFRVFGTILVVSIIFSYFLMTSSLIDKLAFNWSNVNMGNTNESYYTFNASDGDFTAVKWVSNNRTHHSTIYGDRYGALHLTAFGNRLPTQNIKDDLLTGIITKNSYVYLDSTNIQYNRAYYLYDGQVFSFSVPIKMAGELKNTIYSSQKTRIFR